MMPEGLPPPVNVERRDFTDAELRAAGLRRCSDCTHFGFANDPDEPARRCLNPDYQDYRARLSPVLWRRCAAYSSKMRTSNSK